MTRFLKESEIEDRAKGDEWVVAKFAYDVATAEIIRVAVWDSRCDEFHQLDVKKFLETPSKLKTLIASKINFELEQREWQRGERLFDHEEEIA